MIQDRKPTIALDFDGVVHAYSRGWQDGKVYDTVTPGFFIWAIEAAKHFRLVIHSSRANNEFGQDQIREWLKTQALHSAGVLKGEIPPIEISATKPPAWITIDDRCVRFNGDWFDPALLPEALLAFRPWMQREDK